jgi:hypothetical protein
MFPSYNCYFCAGGKLSLQCALIQLGWLPLHPSAETVAQTLKQARKRTCRPEHVVRATGGGSVAGAAMPSVASTMGLSVVVG